MFFLNKRRARGFDLSPDEIFIDSSNLPDHDKQQFEGQLEKPINRRTFYGLGIFCLLIFLIFFARVFSLGVISGQEYASRSLNNSLDLVPIFAERGNIYDRLGTALAWTGGGLSSVGTSSASSSDLEIVSNKSRVYIDQEGFGHLLGYVSYPNEKEMSTGKYNPKEFLGRSGVEKQQNNFLLGQRGKRIVEVDAQGEEISDHIIEKPIPGKEINLAVDSRVQAKMYELLKQTATERGYLGGAGLIMDIKTGEMLALVSFPDYDPNVLSQGKDRQTISRYFSDQQKIMLNRAVSGLYAPGSTFKIFVAVGALMEKIVDPLKTFATNGKLVIPNPYDKTKETVFGDWQNNGVLDMRKAIAMSGDVYFYIIGGGFGSQRGLGIKNIEKYAKIFGLDSLTKIDLPGEETGTIPSPAWKAKNFSGEPWWLGNTYHTSIGQYGVQITPIELLRAYAAIANDGHFVQPTVLKIKPEQAVSQASLPITSEALQIVREGMRQAVTSGTITPLKMPELAIAAKTGSAEVGLTKARVNSWVGGFWPYEKPRFAFVMIMEKGPRTNAIGSTATMHQFFDWLKVYAPEYLKSEN